MWTKDAIEISVKDIFDEAIMRTDGVIEVTYRPLTWNRDGIVEFRPGSDEYRALIEVIGPMKPGEKKDFLVERLDRDLKDIHLQFTPEMLLASIDAKDEFRVCMNPDESISVSLGPNLRTTIRYTSDLPQYDAILSRSGPLKPGQEWSQFPPGTNC